MYVNIIKGTLHYLVLVPALERLVHLVLV